MAGECCSLQACQDLRSFTYNVMFSAIKKLGVLMEGVVTDAKLYDVYDLWKRKPRQLAFNDTDVIVVKVKSGDKEIEETFFTCMKGDGTFSTKTPSKRSVARRNKLARFLMHYFDTNPEEYNLKENIKSWKGRRVQIKDDRIFIPLAVKKRYYLD